MQPTAQTGIVWKISIFLFILLAVVLYKMNDYFKQEKYTLTQAQLRTQIVSIKTSVASQIATLKNVLSSYEYDLSESKINWVQLDPFFGIAKAERVGGRGSSEYRVKEFIGRSGSIGAHWNTAFLQKALTRQISTSEEAITVQMFRDASANKFISLRFSNPNGQALIVVGSAEYFQKYFDVSRGGKTTALLETTDHILAAHSEADYLGSLIDENAMSAKKFLVEREEIAGTNLIAMNFIGRKNLAKGFVVPWSVVGLIFGFGFLIIGVLIYTLEPIERRIEKYKMQEREQIFKETLSTSLAEQQPISEEIATTKLETVDTTNKSVPVTATELVQSKIETQPPLVEEPSGLLSVIEAQPPKSLVPPPPIEVNIPLAPPPVPLPLPSKGSASVAGSVILDSSQIEGLEYMPSDGGDAFDLEKVLSLDDIDSEEVTNAGLKVVQENLTSKTINTTQQVNDVSKPTFAMRRKEFKVDAVEVPIRRPERT